MSEEQSSVQIRQVPIDGGSRVVIAGELDLDRVEALQAGIGEALAAGGDVELDLTAVRFIDSSALKVLVGGLNAVGPDRCFVITDASPVVSRLFELTGLSAIFGLPANSD